jgi:hypothetical protein
VPGQTVTFTWNNGSGAAGYLFRVFVNDNNMTSVTGPWNVSDGGYAFVNSVPRVMSSPASRSVQALMDYSFEVVAWDNDTLDNASLVYTWNWGDGTTTVTDSGITTHQWTGDNVDRTVTVNIDDMFVDDLAISHNLTRTFSVHVAAFELSLIQGWNLVTVPPTGFGYRTNNLGLRSGDTVASFDSVNRTYKSYIVGTPFGVFDILPSTGYWIYAGVNETLYLHGSIPTGTQTKTITVPVGGGWAIVGLNSLSTTMKASNLKASFTGGTVSVIASYDPITRTYKSYVGSPPSDFYLVPGQAYWMYVTASGTLSYSP